jgi:hypothetical protein
MMWKRDGWMNWYHIYTTCICRLPHHMGLWPTTLASACCRVTTSQSLIDTMVVEPWIEAARSKERERERESELWEYSQRELVPREVFRTARRHWISWKSDNRTKSERWKQYSKLTDCCRIGDVRKPREYIAQTAINIQGGLHRHDWWKRVYHFNSELEEEQAVLGGVVVFGVASSDKDPSSEREHVPP